MFLHHVKHFIVHCIIATAALIEYYRAVLFFAFGGEYGECPSFKNDEQAKLHAFSFGGVASMWNKTEYRGEPLHKTLKNELSHVSIPWTILPLSFWLRNKIFYFLFIIFIFPSLCLVLAINKKRVRKFKEIPKNFQKKLLHPNHWLCLWLQGFVFINRSTSHNATLESYELEKQHKLFVEARNKNISTTECCDTDAIIVKNEATEGELGIQYFENGGDWVIQNMTEPHELLQNVIPNNYPAPRFHVITVAPVSQDEEKDEPIRVVSCVLQVDIPQKNAKGHKDLSIYFNVDIENNTIENGTSRSHWYNSGIFSPLRFRQWKSHNHVTSIEGKRVAGTKIDEIENLITLATKAHATLAPSVPLGSWVLQLGKEGAYLERVFFLTANWSRFANKRLFYKALSSRLLYYQVKEIVKETVSFHDIQ